MGHRVLHSAIMFNPSRGIIEQMAWEKKSASAHSLPWRVAIFTEQGVDLGVAIQRKSTFSFRRKKGIHGGLNWFLLRRHYYQWLKSQAASVDVYVLRYSVHDPLQLLFLLTCKKPVCFVHHTLEVKELASVPGLVGRVRASLESVLGRLCIGKSRAIIGVTQEIVDYEKNRIGNPEKPSFIYPNGVFFDEGDVLQDLRQDLPEILFVASDFYPWHGLDLLLDSLKSNQEAFVLHVVGKLSVQDAETASKDARVVLHGEKTSDDIRAMASRCWAGLSSFALQRKGMREACTLKVREYLMLGLPVYSGHRDVFPNAFPFYRCGAADIAEILKFAKKHRSADRAAIRQEAYEYIDKGRLLLSLKEYLDGQKP